MNVITLFSRRVVDAKDELQHLDEMKRAVRSFRTAKEQTTKSKKDALETRSLESVHLQTSRQTPEPAMTKPADSRPKKEKLHIICPCLIYLQCAFSSCRHASMPSELK